MARSEGAAEVLPEPSPMHLKDSFTPEHILPNGSSDTLPRLTPIYTSTQLQELPLVFAMEVSSTSERAFSQEKNTASYLTSKLEPNKLAV
jgi:hypothetical protein